MTSVLETPGTADKAFLTVIGQTGHVMDGTSSVTVLVSTKTGNGKASNREIGNFLLEFIGSLLSRKVVQRMEKTAQSAPRRRRSRPARCRGISSAAEPAHRADASW